MQSTFEHLAYKGEQLNQRRIAHFNVAILELERTYSQIQERGTTSIWDGVRSSYLILKIYACTIETYFLAFGFWAMALASSTFVAHEVGSYDSPILPSLMTILLSTAVPVALAFLTISIHTFYNVRVTIMTVVHVVLSALTVSLIQPLMFDAIFEIEAPTFARMFATMMLIYTLTNLYLALLLKDKICIVAFERRQVSKGYNDLIPPDKRGNLIGLASQDHYVEFITDKGAHLHRISMKDAITRLPNDFGMQVHRSHWAAFAAMSKLETSAGRYKLTLSNGSIIPVSKAKLAAVRAVLDQH